MKPIKNFGEGDDFGEAAKRRREETLSHYRELLESMGRLGIKLLCYNFMVGKGWSRTGVRVGRGGAKATYFSLSEINGHADHAEEAEASASSEGNLHVSTCPTRLKLSDEQVWANYGYFIKAVMPTAEKCGIRMTRACLRLAGMPVYSVRWKPMIARMRYILHPRTPSLSARLTSS